jgi:hypothetical protein
MPLVFIAEREHALKLALMAARKAAAFGEAVRFLKRAKEAIPPRDVPIIEPMNNGDAKSENAASSHLAR